MKFGSAMGREREPPGVSPVPDSSSYCSKFCGTEERYRRNNGTAREGHISDTVQLQMGAAMLRIAPQADQGTQQAAEQSTALPAASKPARQMIDLAGSCPPCRPTHTCVSSSCSTAGLYGGRASYTRCQSTPAKKGCALISAAPPWLPSRSSTSHRRREMKSRAAGVRAASASGGKRR